MALPGLWHVTLAEYLFYTHHSFSRIFGMISSTGQTETLPVLPCGTCQYQLNSNKREVELSL